MTKQKGTFPPEVAITYNQIMTYFDYDKNVEICDSLIREHSKLLNPIRPRILELGVGTGHFASRLQKRGYAVVGIDDSYKMIEELCKQYPDLDARVQNIAELDIPMQFDVAVSAAGPIRFNYYGDEKIFESYIPSWERTVEAIRRVHRHLLPYGLLIMSQNSESEQPGFFKSTGDDMEVPGGLHYEKRERRDSDFIYKVRKLTQGDDLIWEIEHKFSWKPTEIAEQTFRDLGFEIIGFDQTNTYHISRKR